MTATTAGILSVTATGIMTETGMIAATAGIINREGTATITIATTDDKNQVIGKPRKLLAV